MFDFVKSLLNKKNTSKRFIDNVVGENIFYGDIEVYKKEINLEKLVASLRNKSDSRILISKEFNKIKKLAIENPKDTINEIEKIGESSRAMKQVTKTILRYLAHSEEEKIRSFAFKKL